MSLPRHAFNAEISALLAVGIAAVVLRLWLRARTVGGLGRLAVDDYLVVSAAAAYGAETSLAFVAENKAAGLTNGFMEDGTRAAVASSASGAEYAQRVLGSTTQLGSWASHSVAVCIVKAVVCLLYLRLAGARHGRGRTAALLGLVLVAASWLGIMLTLLLSCRPLPRMWQLAPDPGRYCQPASSPTLVWTSMSLGVATYLYLMAVSAPCLMKTGVPTRHKLTTGGLLAGGLLACLAAVNRAVAVSTYKNPGLGRKWEVRETCVALLTANMAAILTSYMGRSESSDGGCGSSTPTQGAASPGSAKAGDEEEARNVQLESRSGDGRGIERSVEICVREDDVYIVKSGNYTGVWSGDDDARQTRSLYFGDDIHQLAYPTAARVADRSSFASRRRLRYWHAAAALGRRGSEAVGPGPGPDVGKRESCASSAQTCGQ